MVRTSVSVALAAFLVVTAIVIIPGAQAVSVSAPQPMPLAPFVTVGVTFNDPDVTFLQGLVLHFDCELSGKFSESMGQTEGSSSKHARLDRVTNTAHEGYGYLQVTQTGYGYVLGEHGYWTGVTGAIPTGYGYSGNGNSGYGYSGNGYGYGYGYGYDSGTLIFVFEMIQGEFKADEECTLVVEVVPLGNPSGDFESPRSPPFTPRQSPHAITADDFAVLPGKTGVRLEGGQSVDPNDGPDPLTYQWQQVGDPTVVLQGASTENATFNAPLLPQTLQFSLTVYDGLDHDTDLVNVTIGLVHVGGGSVLEGTLVTVDATTAITGDSVSYEWTIQSDDVPVVLSDNQTLDTSFLAPEVEDAGVEIVLRLTVSSDEVTAFAEATYIVRDNEAPVAIAGNDLITPLGTPILLNGLASFDPDSDALEYKWTVEGATGTLNDDTVAQPLFTVANVNAPVTSVTLRLDVTEVYDEDIVTDAAGLQGTDFVTVLLGPPAPLLANAGPDQGVLEGATVTLSGEGSRSASGYSWRAVTEGAPTLDTPTSVEASFEAPFVTQTTSFVYELEVTGVEGPLTDTVTVTVYDAQDPHAPQSWFLHTTGCIAADLVAAVNTLQTSPQSGGSQCIRVAAPLLTPTVSFTAAGQSRAVATGTQVTGQLAIAFLLPAGTDSPALAGVSIDVTLVKGATPTPFGTATVTTTSEDPVYGLNVPGLDLTYQVVDFTIQTTAPLDGGSFALQVRVAPTIGLSYVIGLDGQSSITFPAAGAAPGSPTVSVVSPVTVLEGAQVNLAATASDPDGGLVTFTWFQIGGQIPVVLNDASTATAKFTAPQVPSLTLLRFRLVVKDDEGLSANAVDVNVNVQNVATPNPAPVVIVQAGPSRQVVEGAEVKLTGSVTDPDGDFLQSRWTQVGGPHLVGGSASGTTSAPIRSFVAPDVDAPTVFRFQLKARDNDGGQDMDEVAVTVRPTDAAEPGPSGPQVIVIIPQEPQPDGPAAPDQDTDEPVDTDEVDPVTTPDDDTPDEPKELDSDGDGIPDRIEIALGSNPHFAGDVPSFDISETLVVENVDGVNVISWPILDIARGYQLWSSNSPYVLVATLDADERSYADPDGKPTTKYKLTYFIERTKAGGFLADASELASLPGWNEATATTLATSFPLAASPGPGRALPLWAFTTVVLLALTIVTLLGVLALRGRRQA